MFQGVAPHRHQGKAKSYPKNEKNAILSVEFLERMAFFNESFCLR